MGSSTLAVELFAGMMPRSHQLIEEMVRVMSSTTDSALGSNPDPGAAVDAFRLVLADMSSPAATLNRSGIVTWHNDAWKSAPGSRPGVGQDAPAHFALAGDTQFAGELRAVADGRRESAAGTAAQASVLATRLASGALVISSTPPATNGTAGDGYLYRIVESAMDAIITIDQAGRVVLFNTAAEKMFGVPAAEAMGQSLDRFLPAKERAAHHQQVQHFGRTGVSSRTMGNLGTITGCRADGTEFAMEASISQVVVGGQRYYSAILRDISDRKRLEAQLLQAQKMEGVGRLAGGIAHDFNNLLMAIFNYLALASRKLGPEHPVTPSLTQAHQAAQRAADLTRQLLTFARKQNFAPRVMAAHEVVVSLSPMLSRLIGEDVHLHTSLAQDTGNVRADPAQLEQVLANLAVNARDAMPNGGTLTIETRNEVLDDAYCRTHLDAVPGEHVVLSVSDTGVGMTPEVQARIFEPFFTTKPVGKGTGLGLATCHGIVKQCGGHIGVYSEVGRGTSVRVYLPRVHAGGTKKEPPRAAPEPAPRGSETILLAEDSALVRELVAEELRASGYRVLAAASGPEALEIIRSNPGKIDLLLTDVVMPEMSGVQLAERVLSILDIPVIYMSGYTDETISHHGVDPAKVPFIAKPAMTDTLLRLVHRVLHAGPG